MRKLIAASILVIAGCIHPSLPSAEPPQPKPTGGSSADDAGSIRDRAASSQTDVACSNQLGQKLSTADLQTRLDAHQQWLANGSGTRAELCQLNLMRVTLNGVNLGGADLRGANLMEAHVENATFSGASLEGATLMADFKGSSFFGAHLRGANLGGANLERTNFRIADLRMAHLEDANLQHANLREAQLDGAYLFGANLSGASLEFARLQGAIIAYANLTQTQYAPRSAPPDDLVTGIQGLSSVVVPNADFAGLIQLRQLLVKAGLPQERDATYAIERNRTSALLRGFGEHSTQGLFNRLDGAFRVVMFDWPVEYGLRAGKALRLLIYFAIAFAIVYAVALQRKFGDIFKVLPKDRLESKDGQITCAGAAAVTLLQPTTFGSCLWIGLQFSLQSAFYIGFRDLNLGEWTARLRASEYSLQALGWMRIASGVQSLLSVYLVAIWIVTYFGRPFG